MLYEETKNRHEAIETAETAKSSVCLRFTLFKASCIHYDVGGRQQGRFAPRPPLH